MLLLLTQIYVVTVNKEIHCHCKHRDMLSLLIQKYLVMVNINMLSLLTKKYVITVDTEIWHHLVLRQKCRHVVLNK